jgi:cobalamin biosynthesis protein CobT
MVVVLLLFLILCFSFFNLFQSCVNRDGLIEIKTQLTLLDQTVSKIMDISEDVIETLAPDEEDEYEEDSDDDDGEEDDASDEGENETGNDSGDEGENEETGNDAGDEGENDETVNDAEDNNDEIDGHSKKKLARMMIQIMKRVKANKSKDNKAYTSKLIETEFPETKTENATESSLVGEVKKRHKKHHHKTTTGVVVPENEDSKKNE